MRILRHKNYKEEKTRMLDILNAYKKGVEKIYDNNEILVNDFKGDNSGITTIETALWDKLLGSIGGKASVNKVYEDVDVENTMRRAIANIKTIPNKFIRDTFQSELNKFLEEKFNDTFPFTAGS
jgi:hypothetical protein